MAPKRGSPQSPKRPLAASEELATKGPQAHATADNFGVFVVRVSIADGGAPRGRGRRSLPGRSGPGSFGVFVVKVSIADATPDTLFVVFPMVGDGLLSQILS